MIELRERFIGCLLGAAVGDVLGAVVEAETPGYVRSRFNSVEDLLRLTEVEELFGKNWRVGQVTDDTLMMLDVARWLIDDKTHSPQQLLELFVKTFDPSRRYGSGTDLILRTYPQNPSAWRELSTMMFPMGSYGNGSAMRVAPVGLAYRRQRDRMIETAVASSRPTHSHPFAYQAAVLQATAVARLALHDEFDASVLLAELHHALEYFGSLQQEVKLFQRALHCIAEGLEENVPSLQMAEELGTSVTAHESWPMALYCFMRNADSFSSTIRDAIFAGGDTDTIASMAGALSGTRLGSDAIPSDWIAAMKDEKVSTGSIFKLAILLFDRFGSL